MSSLKMYLIIKMDYIQIVLLVYLLLRIVDFFPSQNFVLNNLLQNLILVTLLVLLLSFDPIICLLVMLCIIVNIKNEAIENLFTSINSNEIESIRNTLKPKHIKTEVKEETVVEDITKDEEECIPEFIISKEMLNRAQDNIVDDKNNNIYLNETNQNGVNIQGIYEDLTGYNI